MYIEKIIAHTAFGATFAKCCNFGLVIAQLADLCGLVENFAELLLHFNRHLSILMMSKLLSFNQQLLAPLVSTFERSAANVVPTGLKL